MGLNKTVSLTVIILLLFLFILVCFYSYLLADWPVNDSIGRYMTEKDWYDYSIESAVFAFAFGSIFVLFLLVFSFLIIKFSGFFRIKKTILILSVIYVFILINTCIFSAIKIYLNKSWF